MTYAERAALADLITIVKGRFIEAADTLAHVDVGQIKPSKMKSAWPAMQLETFGVGGHHPGYGINGDRLTYRPSSVAISRAEEVMYGWLLDYAKGDEERMLLSKWSSCMASPKTAGSFREFCKKTGRSRSTAERRVNQALQRVSLEILKKSKSLQGPDWSRVMPMMPNQRMHGDKLDRAMYWRAPDAVPQGVSDQI